MEGSKLETGSALTASSQYNFFPLLPQNRFNIAIQRSLIPWINWSERLRTWKPTVTIVVLDFIMFLIRDTPTPYSASANTASPVPTLFASPAASGGNAWSPWAICGLVLGLLALLLAVPGCIHAYKQLRRGQAASVTDTPLQPVEQTPVQLRPLPQVLYADSISRPRVLSAPALLGRGKTSISCRRSASLTKCSSFIAD